MRTGRGGGAPRLSVRSAIITTNVPGPSTSVPIGTRSGRSPETRSAGAGMDESTPAILDPGDSRRKRAPIGYWPPGGADVAETTRAPTPCSPVSAPAPGSRAHPRSPDHRRPDPSTDRGSAGAASVQFTRLRRGHRLPARYGAHHDSRAGSTPGAVGGDRLLRAPGRAAPGAPTRCGCPDRARRAACPAVRPHPRLARTLRGRRPGAGPRTAPGSSRPAVARTKSRTGAGDHRTSPPPSWSACSADQVIGGRDQGSGGPGKAGEWPPGHAPVAPGPRYAEAHAHDVHRSRQEGGAGTAKRRPAPTRAWPRCGGCRLTARRAPLNARSVDTRRYRSRHGPSRAATRRDVSLSPRSARRVWPSPRRGRAAAQAARR